METTTPFDLNLTIQKWRESLEQSPAFRRENLDELETHLRDSIVAFQQRGLSEEEAFLIAIKRAGSGAALGAEFGKMNARGIWLDRVMWMLVGNLVFWLVSSLVSLFGSSLLYFGFREFSVFGGNLSNYLSLALFSTLINLLTFAGALAICWHYLFKRNWRTITAWLAKNSRSPAGFAMVSAIGIVAMLLARGIQFSGSALLMNLMSLEGHAQFMMGQNMGNWIASLIESSVFVFLALWLARRRLLAKT